MSGILLAEGVVEVTADAKGVPREIAKDIENGENVTRKAGEKIGKQVFGGIVGAWAAIGGAQIIGDFFKGSITGASDLGETLSKSSAIFGTSASAIESFGNTAARSVGLSKEAAIAAAAGFGDMFSQLGFATDAAAAMSQQVVIASADLGSFNNLETADVADRISAAFRGEYDSLQAVIPNINAARVESEALAATGKTLASELTAAEKASAVLAIVQTDGARAMGDFEKTSGGAANQTKIMTAQMEDQQARLGGILLPAWTGFLGFLNNDAIPAFSSVIDWMSQNGDTLLWLGGIVAGGATAYWAINSALTIFKAYQVAAAAATGGLTIAQWAWNAAVTANPLGLIIVAIGAVVAGIVWLATQTTFFQDLWTNVTTFLGDAWTWLWGTVLEPVFTAIGDAFTWLYNNAILPVATFISEAVTNIATVFTWIYESIIMPVVTGIMLYIGLWAALIQWLWESVAMPVFNAIGALFTWLGQNVFAPIGAAIGFVMQGIGAAFNWVYNSIILPIANFIGGAIRTVGSVISWLHSSIVAPVMSAVGAAFNWVWRSVISPVVNFISGAIRNVGNTVRSVFGGIGSFIGSAFQAALNVVRGPINGIIGLVNSAIRGLNSLSVTIPSWVPLVGGQTWGLSIPTIPMLARGTKNAPDVFIAGEAGPELIVGAGGSKVYPANETRNKLDGNGSGDTNIDIEINEAEDPLGSAGRVAAELRKWRKK